MKEKGYVLKGEVKELKVEVPADPEIEKKRVESWDKGNLSDQVWVGFGIYHNDKSCPYITRAQNVPSTMMTRREAIRQSKTPCQWCVR
jgi:hypothetical protein